MTRLLVGVDAPLLRTGLEAALRQAPTLEVVGWAGAPLALVEQVRPAKPDVLVCAFDDLRSSLQVAQAVPDVPVLVIADVTRQHDLLDALRTGVRGLLPRTCTASDLASTAELLSRGGLAYPSGWERVLVDRLESVRGWRPRDEETDVVLTRRESQVLELLLEGLSVKQAAARLGIALQTTKNHIHHVMVKTGAQSRVELFTWAVRHGYQPPAGSGSAERRTDTEDDGQLGAAVVRRAQGAPDDRDSER